MQTGLQASKKYKEMKENKCNNKVEVVQEYAKDRKYGILLNYPSIPKACFFSQLLSFY